jgi:SAM-dependent methyltransferase
LPWWLKILAKIILSRLPFGYSFWQRLSLFRHGAMDDPDYVFRNFDQHYEAAGKPGSGEGFAALELGPGDSLASALVINGMGGAACWLVDAGDFARKDMEIYKTIATSLQSRGVSAPDLKGITSTEGMLSLCEAHYLTNGLEGLRTIPDSSVDFIWSQAVLEHVRKHEFSDTMKELRRILKPTGACSHRIDLRDHLSANLNNLRFSNRVWESAFFTESGFYTNRLGYEDILAEFNSAGFEIDVGHVDRWEKPPLPRWKLSREFLYRTDIDLTVSGFNVILRPIGTMGAMEDMNASDSVSDHWGIDDRL